jgi:hypothetical protein
MPGARRSLTSVGRLAHAVNVSHEIETAFQGWAEGLEVEISDRRWLRQKVGESIAVAVLLLPDDDRNDPSQTRVTARGKLHVSSDEYKALEDHAAQVDLTSQTEWTDEQQSLIHS